MSPVELIALSLIVSVVIAALGRWIGGVLDGRLGDAGLRDRLWAGALFLPLVPPVAVGLLLLTPAPERPAVIVTPAPIDAPAPTIAPLIEAAPNVRSRVQLNPEVAAWTLTGLAGLAMAVRGGGLFLRGRRLARLLRDAEPASDVLTQGVEAGARALNVRAPNVRVGPTGGDVLLAGPWRPTLITPPGLEREAAFDLIVRHELGHLKRGDHRAVWLEEALMIALAFNPFVPGLRSRRAAAREEACDALALHGASTETRRLYARRLIEVLKGEGCETAPALSFGGRSKIQPAEGETTMKTPAMRRMAAILTPPRPAGRVAHLMAFGAGLVVLAAAGAASAAVVLQREAATSLVLTESAAPEWSRDGAWVNAALAPVYRSVWPDACGIGQTRDGVTIHLGEGCAGPDVPDARLTRLAGVDLVRDPQAAFQAVRAACETGRAVDLNWTENGAVKSASAACTAPAVAPIPPKMVEIALTFEGLGAPRPGDRLEVVLEREVGDNRHAKSLAFELGAASILPTEVRGQAPQELFAGGQSPKLLARLIGADGVVRARTVARPKPMIVSADRAIAFAALKAVSGGPASGPSHAARSGESAARQAVQAAASSLTPQQRARLERATGEDYKAMCLSDDPLEEGFCSGAMFAALDVPGSSLRVCAPTGGDAQINAITAVNRGKAMMRTVVVQPGQGPRDVARAALATAWPCQTASAPVAGAVMAPVRLDVDRFPALTRGETLTVSLWAGEADGTGPTRLVSRRVQADAAGRFPEMIDMPLASDLFPRFGQSARAYHLTAEVRAANGDSLYGAEPTTLRLAAMGQAAARRLRPELTFRPSGAVGRPGLYPSAAR